MTQQESDQLVLDNLSWAKTLANSTLSGQSVTPDYREDCHAAAMEGLVQAARRYDPSQGIKFRTYAAARILGAVRDYRKKFRVISQDMFNAYKRSMEEGAELPRNLLSGEDGYSVLDQLHLYAQGVTDRQERFINSNMDTQEREYFIRALEQSPEALLLKKEEKDFARTLIANHLNDEMKQLLLDIYVEEKSYEELASERGVKSRATITKRKNAILKHLKKVSVNHYHKTSI